MDARVEHDTSLVRLLTRDIVARSTLEINFLFPHIQKAVFQWCAFFAHVCSIRINEQVYVFWALRTYTYVKKTHHWKTAFILYLLLYIIRVIWLYNV